MTETSIIGKSEPRVDAWQKVTGAARYIPDLQVKDLLHASILRSPHAHAQITGLDTTAAVATPGVLAVITCDDVPGEKVLGDIIPDRPVLATDKVRFVGEPVAVVVARTALAAEEGRKSIRVEYSLLEPLLDPLTALAPDSPAIHAGGNLMSLVEVCDGDIETGFQEADIILDEVFQVPRIYQAYLETETSLAQWQPDGSLTVWASTQKPFHDRTLISKALGLPEEKVTVKTAVIGGAFGGKEDSSLHMLSALAAWKVKGSVRMVNSREESFLAHPKRHAARLHYRLGAKKDGTLTALECTVHLDTGAYASYGPAVGQLLTETVPGPYRIPNVKAQTYIVYTNTPIAGAMRGFGAPQTNFAYESLMDMLAQRLAMDPVELRRRNIFRPGDRSFTRVKINQAEAAARCLDIAQKEQERLARQKPAPGKLAGVGIALGYQTMGLGHRVTDDSANRLEWLPDGRVLLHLGAPELGQGLSTVAAQMTAEALGLPMEYVTVAPLDTTSVPDGGVSCASRMTYMVGNSVILAARLLVEQLLQETARLLGVHPNRLQYQAGFIIRLDQTGAPPIPVNEITSRLAESAPPLSATGVFSFPYGPETPAHLPVGMPHVLMCFSAHVASVEVDPDLGVVEIKELVAIHDAGRVINRSTLEGQIEGAVSMGVGYALSEEMILKPNGNWVDNFTEYLLPTTLDMPPVMKTILLELPEESGPHGAKGIGEMPLGPVAPAIANAVACATSVRLNSIPIKREELVIGIRQAGKR